MYHSKNINLKNKGKNERNKILYMMYHLMKSEGIMHEISFDSQVSFLYWAGRYNYVGTVSNIIGPFSITLEQ